MIFWGLDDMKENVAFLCDNNQDKSVLYEYWFILDHSNVVINITTFSKRFTEH